MLSWYALHCRSNTEEQIARHLDSCHVEAFYPHRVSPAAHAKRQTILKFFPGYLFSRFELEHRLSIMLPQVIRIVSDGVNPAIIPDIEIESVRRICSFPDAVSVCVFEPGKRVRIRYGPLTGAEGIVVALPKNQFKLIVSIEMLGRSICTPIDRDSVEVMGDADLPGVSLWGESRIPTPAANVTWP
jgi:transcription antitermination factor NusG